jgi:uncharacterized protein (DUF1330 family)
MSAYVIVDIVILEFNSASSARKWYNSPEYGLARAIRQGAANFNMVLVEGLA